MTLLLNNTLNSCKSVMNSSNFLKLRSIQIGAMVTIAGLSLVGWHFNIEIFKHPVPGIVAMNPLTSIAFILGGVFFFLLFNSKKHRKFLSIAKIIALLITMLALARIFALAGGIHTHVDTFIYTKKLEKDIINGLPNAMAPNTAFNLLLTGLSLFFISFRNQRFTNLSHGLSLIILFISLLSIVGYIYHENKFYGLASSIPMAVLTAVCFLLMSLSLLFVRSNKGFMAHITGRYHGSKIARILLPVAILVPITLGLLRLHGESKGLYTTEYGAALFSVANVIIFILFIWRGATAINRSDLATSQEIKRRIKTEESTKSANVFLDTILDNIPDMVFVKETKDFRFVRINKKAENILGLSRNELIGKNDFDFFPADQAELFARENHEIVASRNAIIIPEEKITTNNGDRWLSTKKIPVYDENNEPLYVIGISEDITLKKKNEDIVKEYYRDLEIKVQERTVELRKSENHFRSLIENAEDVISLIDRNGRTIYVSPSIEKVTGYTIGERNQHSTIEIIFPDDIEIAQNLFNKVMDNPGVPISYTFRLLHKNGKPVWIEGTLTNLFHDENVNAIISNYHDITEKKLAEEEAAQLKIIKQKEITDAVISAQESERSNIGRELHDNVNQLLGAINLYIGMAKNDAQNRNALLTDASAFTVTAIEEIRKLSKTLISPSVKEIGLKESVKGLAEEIMMVQPVKIILTDNNFTENGLNDRFKLNLFRIVQEQLNNILKHARATTVNINIKDSGDKLFISISDDGIGFDTSKKRSGIGLTNIKSRVELYNGTMQLNSEIGKGTCLLIAFNKSNIV